MSARHSNALLPVVVLLLLAGCSRMEGMATRYRAERMAWEAQREETRLRIGKAAPDSATILEIRDGYARVRAAFPPPFVKGSGADVEKQRRDIARVVGTTELKASRLALQARRGDLALESARWVASVADGDTALRREADFATVMAFRGLHRYDEAIATLRGMLDRYPPIPPPSADQEDQILTVPDALIELHAEIGDDEGAKREQALAVAYFRKLLERKPTPLLEAQIRARLSRTLLEMGDATSALAEVGAMRSLVGRTPALKKLEPELLYTEARIRSMQKDYKKALDLYDLALMKHPGSPFADRALLDAAVISERLEDREGAIARYRSILGRPKPDPEVAPVAAFRLAMVQDQAGNWAEAKQILEGIPLQFPRSRAAIEAPFAVVEHYVRSRQPDAAKASLLKAVETYRALIDRDSTSMYSTVYRWNVLRAYSALERWSDALATVDLMAERDKGAPITAEALYQGAQMARTLGDKARSDIYLNRIVLEYPRSPRAGSIRKFLGRTSGAAANPEKK